MIKNAKQFQYKIPLSVLSIAVLLTAITSCRTDMPTIASKAVIEGYLDSDGYPEVFFTASLSPDEKGAKISDKIIRWGVVKIYDDDKEYILTGGPLRNNIPPYHYYSVDFRGIPGHEYRVTAEYEDMYAEAVCRMPQPTAIDNISFRPVEGIDSLRSCTLQFIAPEDCPAYYVVRITDYDKDAATSVATMSATVAENPGEVVNIPLQLKRNNTSSEGIKSPLFVVGQHLEMHLCRVSREVYEFWKSYDEYLMFSGSAFLKSSKDLEGNVAGGYGVWSAQGVCSQIITVE